MKKKMLFGIFIVLIIIGVVAIASFSFMLYKDRTYFHSPPYSHENGTSDILVVYYSRSGNTEAFARAIAKELEADILRITENRYTLDINGWQNAASDAQNKVRKVKIAPEIYDLARYNTVFLGSPIWLFRPAPPLWSFVENNQFDGKSVVLFNTFNSRFKAENIIEFKSLIEGKGGKLVDHVYIRRGRILFQMTGLELLESAASVAKRGKEVWKMPY
jgi:flavodoxin